MNTIFDLILDMMKLDVSQKIAHDGANGKLPRWVRVWRIIGGIVATAICIALAVWFFMLGLKLIKAAAMLFGICLIALAMLAVATGIAAVLQSLGVFDKLSDGIYSWRYRK